MKTFIEYYEARSNLRIFSPDSEESSVASQLHQCLDIIGQIKMKIPPQYQHYISEAERELTYVANRMG